MVAMLAQDCPLGMHNPENTGAVNLLLEGNKNQQALACSSCPGLPFRDAQSRDFRSSESIPSICPSRFLLRNELLAEKAQYQLIVPTT